MRRCQQSKSYLLLGACAAVEAALKLPPLKRPAGGGRGALEAEMLWLDAVNKRAADDEGAAEIRETLWLTYDRRLRDDRSYDIADIHEWITEQIDEHLPGKSLAVGQSSVYRDSNRVHARQRAMVLAHQRAQQMMEAMGDGAEGDVLKGGRMVAGQLIFEALSNLAPEALESLTVPQALNMVDSLSRLSKANAESDLITLRVQAMQAEFDRQIEAAQRQVNTDGGSLTSEMIAQIREATFGSAA